MSTDALPSDLLNRAKAMSCEESFIRWWNSLSPAQRQGIEPLGADHLRTNDPPMISAPTEDAETTRNLVQDIWDHWEYRRVHAEDFPLLNQEPKVRTFHHG